MGRRALLCPDGCTWTCGGYQWRDGTEFELEIVIEILPSSAVHKKWLVSKMKRPMGLRVR